MLSHDEHQAMIMFDRLLMAAKDNETVADLLDQTLNVARMIDPRPDDKVVYGPLQRMYFDLQQLQSRLHSMETKLVNINNQKNWGHVGIDPNYSTTNFPTHPISGVNIPWPSNPGWGINANGFATSTSKTTSAIDDTQLTALSMKDMAHYKHQIDNLNKAVKQAQKEMMEKNSINPKTDK